MSKVVTASTTQSSGTSASTTQSVKVPHDKIAMRAYEKWCKRGQPQGTHVQDWLEAETELRAELTRQNAGTSFRR